MSIILRGSRAMLCAGVSLAALSLAYPVHAADLNPSLWTKAPILDRGEFRGFIEGGMFWTGGDRVPYCGGFTAFDCAANSGSSSGMVAVYTRPWEFFDNRLSDFFSEKLAGGGTQFPAGSDPAVRPGLGWDVAAGMDYRFAGSPWHINMEGRYGRVTKLEKGATPFASSFGQNRTNTGEFFFGCADNDINCNNQVINASAVTTPSLTESHWQADFGMGYDFIRGAQINFGFRIAEVRSDIIATTGLSLTATAVANTSVPCTALQAELCASVSNPGSTTTTANAGLVQTDLRSFFGAGPRIGLTGSIPLIGAWTFDYIGDAALLFGNTKFSTGQVLGFNSSTTTTIPIPTYLGGRSNSLSGLSLNQLTWTAPNTVYNFDIQAGVSYWFTPNWALKLSYRLDAFIDALRVAPDDGATRTDIGPGRSMDRYYHGAKVALMAKY